MLKNKIIVRKIRNIVILLMALIVMIGAYSNIRRSRAENVIEITMEVADKDNILSLQTITAEATETEDGLFLLNLPESVNGNFVTKYHTSNGEEVVFDMENPEPTLQLTEEEVTNQKIQIETTYDKKEVTVEGQEEATMLYKKELKYNEEVIVTGYMPLNSQLETNEIDLSTLTDVKLPNEAQTMKKAYELSIFEEIEVAVEEEATVEPVEEKETTSEAEEATAEPVKEEEATSETEEEAAEPVNGEEATSGAEEATAEPIKEEEATSGDEETTAEVISEEETITEEQSSTEVTDIEQTNTITETTKIEYDPTIYEEKLQVTIKYKKENEKEKVTIYKLGEENQIEEITTTAESDGVVFETEQLEKYIVATEVIEIIIENINIEDNLLGTNLSTSSGAPSDIFDSEGTNTDGLHIGDFVNYDAGTWTQAEINAIQVGPTSALVTANGSTSLPSEAFQFGGFTAGSSRNGNATPSNSSYNYVKDTSTGEAITGWRVFDIEDDGTVTLISAGNPEDYVDPMGDYRDLSQYILIGKGSVSNYQKRDWSDYVNTFQNATSATLLTKSRLDTWYIKYMGITSGSTWTSTTFQRIYEEPYIKYQNIVDNYSYYNLCEALDIDCSFRFSPGSREVQCSDTYRW